LPALRAKLSQHSGYVPLAYQVSGTVEQRVADLDLPYLSFAPDVARTDPDGNLFSPILGIVGFSGKGLSGLEYLKNSLLAGSPGSEVVPTGPNGQGLPGNPHRRRRSAPGHEPRAQSGRAAPVRGHDGSFPADQSH